VYAMAGARNLHNRIASNTLISLGIRLRGRRCEAFNSDTKIRIPLPKQVRFYYADAMVVCQPNPGDDSFQDHPVVIFEVLSRGTRRIDEGEKKDAYVTLPSLAVYVLIEQDTPALTAFRRNADGFVREDYDGLEAVLRLPEIGIELPLAEIYEAVTFIAEKSEEDR